MDGCVDRGVIVWAWQFATEMGGIRLLSHVELGITSGACGARRPLGDSQSRCKHRDAAKPPTLRGLTMR